MFFIPLVALFFACTSSPKDASELDLTDFKQKISYALGADMGTNFTNVPEDIFAQLNKAELENGFYQYLTKENLKSVECREILEAALSNGNGIDTTKHKMSEISHCYGSIFGEMLRNSLVGKDAMDEINPDIARIGFANSLNKTDTLIPIEERQQMIMNFNNDLNNFAGEEFMNKMAKKHKHDVKEEGYILLENAEGTGAPIDLTGEYNIVYTMTNIAGDTIISTLTDPKLSDLENAQVVNADDIVFPEAWKIAAKHMKVGGDYTIHTSHELAYGEEGLRAPNSPNYVIQPFSAVTIYSKVLSQGERHAGVKAKGMEVLEQAKNRPNTKVYPEGFILTTLEEGTGPKVKKGADVQAHYILSNSNGDVIENSFMSSSQNNQPAPSFSLNGVVKGWQLAIPEMKEGGRYKLVLPYDLAYGEQGNQSIQPFETLTFEIQVIKSGEPGTLVQPRQPQQQQQFSEEQMRQLQEQLKEQQ
ncbi:FKBP-type peptidyl-prolyl cis-trans isomerase [Brumimicrobium mesophilum]|uniref:FKBP-type peptidyl-prolyl cis-trans isomerase n=1 Tax=Brumimicrobium mesophilum TaxID=392717 RepID=UPI001F1E0295|nr:FKBP-type peptidyl-prolyl cis-trans isomerase [Brumimicrobium mesophilum]